LTFSHKEIVSTILGSIEPHELSHCIVYLCLSIIPEGRISFPRISIEVSRASYLAFIDLDPLANWGHPTRYLLVEKETGKRKVIDAEFPPLGSNNKMKWDLLYKSQSIPDQAVMKFN
jgi:hypothetical protein